MSRYTEDMTKTEKSTIDATMPLTNCLQHGSTPQAYLNDGRYGCVLCNPTRVPFRGLPPVGNGPLLSAPVGEMPDWMC